MEIGATIRRLRRERDMTQEQLAEYLSISVSAVSQWESEKTAPDIALLPPLANLFGVSADVLLGLEPTTQEEELRLHGEDVMSGKYIANLDKTRALSKKYPRNYSLQMDVAITLISKFWEETGSPDNNANGDANLLHEAESICLRVLAECTDSGTRGLAYQYIRYVYGEINTPLYSMEKAIAVAESAPSVWTISTCEELRRSAYFNLAQRNDDDEARKKAYELNGAIILTALKKLSGMGEYATDKIFAYQQLLKIYEIVFYDGNYMNCHNEVCEIHYDMVIAHVLNEDYDAALAELRLAAHHAMEHDNQPRGWVKYTNKFLSGIDGTSNLTEPWKVPGVLIRFDAPRVQKLFAPIRNHPEFIAILEELRQYAAQWRL